MPRSIEEIIAHANEHAQRFEQWEPTAEELASKRRDVRYLHRLRAAVRARGEAEAELLEAVRSARANKYSWSAIGAELGVSAAAVQQKYGHLIEA